MNAKTRTIVTMATQVADFSHANPHENAGHVAAVNAVDALIAQARLLLAAQRQGIVDEHNAALRKRELERTMRSIHLAAVAGAGRLAAREQADLAGAFPVKPASESYLAFRSTAASMAELAGQHKDLLVKHGMPETVLDDLDRAIGEFDAATQLGVAGRAAHISATANLEAVSKELVARVRVLDGFNRIRFRDDPARLAAWASASSVRATAKGASAENGDGSEAGGSAGAGGSTPAAGGPSAGERPAA